LFFTRLVSIKKLFGLVLFCTINIFSYGQCEGITDVITSCNSSAFGGGVAVAFDTPAEATAFSIANPSISIGSETLSFNSVADTQARYLGACITPFEFYTAFCGISQIDANGDGIPDIEDPCSCADPENIVGSDGIVDYFHDFITVTMGAPGETWEVTSNTGMVDANLLPISAANGNNTLTHLGGGVYKIDFWHPANTGFSGAVVERTAGGAAFTFPALANACAACQQTPSLGQWGLIILALLLITLGFLYVTAPQISLGNGVKVSGGIQWRNLPFDKKMFFKLWAMVALCFIIGFLIAVSFFDYEVTTADPFGTVIASAIMAYMFMIIKRESK